MGLTVKGHPHLRWIIFFCIVNGFSGSITVRNCTSIWNESAMVTDKCPLYDHSFYLIPLAKVLHGDPSLGWPLISIKRNVPILGDFHPICEPHLESLICETIKRGGIVSWCDLTKGHLFVVQCIKTMARSSSLLS